MDFAALAFEGGMNAEAVAVQTPAQARSEARVLGGILGFVAGVSVSAFLDRMGDRRDNADCLLWDEDNNRLYCGTTMMDAIAMVALGVSGAQLGMRIAR